MTPEITLGRATFRKSEGGITVQTGPASIRAAIEAEDVLRLFAWLASMLGHPERDDRRRIRRAARTTLDLIHGADLTEGAPDEFAAAVQELEAALDDGGR
jgi:hypothetical protein